MTDKPKPPPEGNDRNYRRFYGNAEIVEGTLRALDQPWVCDLDFSTLKQVSEIFTGTGIDKREGDSVWQVQWKGKPLYVYLAFEFQSKPLWYMAIKVWALLGMLYLRLIDSGVLPQGLLPAVIPIVVYNGKPDWKAARSTRELFDVPPGLEWLQPLCSYLLIDMHRIPFEDLEGMERPVAVLFQLEQSQGPQDIVHGLRRLLRMLPEGHPLRAIFAAWLRTMVLPIKAPGIDIPEMVELEEMQTMLAESVLEWKAEWIEEGVEKGQVRMVSRQLELKFGPLAEDIRAHVSRATTDQLDLWSERILTATRLDEVFQ
jgi:hypothetical protein